MPQARSQYVARPPEMSKTPPVEDEQSSDASQHTVLWVAIPDAHRRAGREHALRDR